MGLIERITELSWVGRPTQALMQKVDFEYVASGLLLRVQRKIGKHGHVCRL